MDLSPELEFIFGKTASVFQRTRVISREMIAENTLALIIERPEGFTFEAGQNTTISIPGKYAEDLREFSIASAPYEKDILIAMRVRSSNFKNACYALQPGDAISLRTAAGSLWQPTAARQVWLSGGIGITPFRSIIRELLHTGLSAAISHIHSDRARATAPFIEEFESYAGAHKGFDFFPTMTGSERAGESHGRITAEMITKLIPEYQDSIYFVAGSEAFITAMRSVVAALGVPQENIRSERFEGYR